MVKGPAEGGCGVETGGRSVVTTVGAAGLETDPTRSSIPTLPPELLVVVDVRIRMAKEAPPMLVMTRLLEDSS